MLIKYWSNFLFILDQEDVEYGNHEEIEYGNHEEVDVNENLVEDISDNDYQEEFTEVNEMDETGEEACDMNLIDGLIYFMILFNISNSAMNVLLKLLVYNNIDVPSNVYLLKKNITIE